MIWIDASVWLEIALGQENAQRCEHFLETHTHEKLFSSDFDVYSIVLTMLKYKKTGEDIKIFLGVLSGLPTLTIFRPSSFTIVEAVTKMNEKKLTFDDALAYASMKQLALNKIATLDSDFRKLDVEMVL